MYSADDMFWTFFFTLLIVFFAGTAIGGLCENGRMRDQAVENNAAHYDTKTGKFEWGAEK
jgi:hypothetical protein